MASYRETRVGWTCRWLWRKSVEKKIIFYTEVSFRVDGIEIWYRYCDIGIGKVYIVTEYRYINIAIHRNNDVSVIRHDFAGIPALMVGINNRMNYWSIIIYESQPKTYRHQKANCWFDRDSWWEIRS